MAAHVCERHEDQDTIVVGEVHISLAPGGGWDVAGAVDGHVITLRHCDDWHHVERMRHRVRGELDALGRALSTAAGIART